MNTFLKVFAFSFLVLGSALIFTSPAHASSTVNVTLGSFNGPFYYQGGACVQSPVLIASGLTAGETIQVSGLSGNVCARFYPRPYSCVSNGAYGCSDSGGPMNLVPATSSQILVGFYNGSSKIQEIQLSQLQTAVTVPSGATSAYVYYKDSDATAYNDNNGGFTISFTATINPATPVCTQNASQKCVGNAVYNFDSCGNKGTLYQQCTSTQTCPNTQCVNQNIVCSTNSDCNDNNPATQDVCLNSGTPQSSCQHNTIACSTNADCASQNSYIGAPFCKTGDNGNVYQNYRTYVCQSPGAPNSSCVPMGSDTAQVKEGCLSGQTCSAGACSQSQPQNTFSIQTLAASNILTNSATLNGNLVNLGSDPSASVWFQWGTTTAYGFETSHQTMTLAGPVNQTISNLTPNAVYHFRAVAQNGSAGVVYGQDMSFTAGNTLFPSQVQTLPATNIQPNSVTLNGQLLSLGGDTSGTIWFQYGPTVSYGSQTSTQTMGITGMFSQTISGLTANTTYQFRAAAQTTSGVIYGSNLSLTTNSTGGLNVSCYASPNPANIGQQVSFICTTTGGSGSYTYQWSGACAGTSSICTTSFGNAGTQTANVVVTAGNQTTTTSTSVTINGNNNIINNTTCIQNSYQRCNGSYLYWYDSCGNQGNQSQYCQNGCSGNACNYYNNYNYNNGYNYNQNYNQYNYSSGNCTYHAYQLCMGNNVYWYNSCGNQQDLVQSCLGTNMVCKYGQCVYSQPVLPPAPPIVYNNYTAHYKIACYANNLYWFDSNGRKSNLYKNCADSNSCTLDSCAAGKCSNILKCDGSTCATGSPDYNNYCATNNNANNSNANNSGANPLVISLFVKQNQNSLQWQKTAQVNSNGQAYFMISVANNSGNQVDNVNVSANIPSEITSLGNLQINGVPVSGDIVAGVSAGSLPPGAAKSITFEGKTQLIPASETLQATATANIPGASQTDAVSINFNPAQSATAGLASSQTASGFWEFLKRWYLWILVGLVLIFLFVVVFRRLSSNV